MQTVTNEHKSETEDRLNKMTHNLRMAAELAPAVRNSTDSVMEMLNSSEEMLLASYLLVDKNCVAEDPSPYTTTEEMIRSASSNLRKSAENFERVRSNMDPGILENLAEASEEILRGIKAFIK